MNFVAPRGAVKCESAQRKRARAANSLAAAPVPLVAGMGGSYAASQKPLTPQSREVPSTSDVMILRHCQTEMLSNIRMCTRAASPSIY